MLQAVGCLSSETVLSIGRHGGRAGAVEVDVLPLAVAAVPDTGLL